MSIKKKKKFVIPSSEYIGSCLSLDDLAACWDYDYKDFVTYLSQWTHRNHCMDGYKCQ